MVFINFCSKVYQLLCTYYRNIIMHLQNEIFSMNYNVLANHLIKFINIIEKNVVVSHFQCYQNLNSLNIILSMGFNHFRSFPFCAFLFRKSPSTCSFDGFHVCFENLFGVLMLLLTLTIEMEVKIFNFRAKRRTPIYLKYLKPNLFIYNPIPYQSEY